MVSLMRIVIVGARGMLGTDLMQAFSDRGELTGLDIDELDITDEARCRARIAAINPNVIINAAAMTRVDDCESRAEEAFRVNALGAGNLAVAASDSGARLVQYSTDYVFDGRKPGPYVEEDPPSPLGVYGRSKLQGEDIVRARCREHLIIRTAWLFGRHGPNFIRTILAAARSGRQLRVVNDQRGSPTYAADLADQSVRLVETGGRGTYHVTNSGSCTWYELARFALDCAGMGIVSVEPATTAEYPRPAPRPANSVLSNARLLREGFPVLRHWTEAVRDYVCQTADGE
jgi:dTDP-4-dehydrorhamnose reductase